MYLEPDCRPSMRQQQLSCAFTRATVVNPVCRRPPEVSSFARSFRFRRVGSVMEVTAGAGGGDGVTPGAD
jgi:hypothetical protein